jgi:hypothetical protein
MSVASGGSPTDVGTPAVVHLVWAPLGPAPLRAFLASYRAHPPGCEHDLVIALSGIDASGVDGDGVRMLLRELDGTEHRLLELGAPTLDLLAYRQAASMLEHDHVCVLNSYSRVRCDGWLLAFAEALRGPDVGLVGASGSWASQGSYAMFHLGLPSPYRRVFGARRATIAQFQALEQERSGRRARGLRGTLDTVRALAADAVGFPPFPAVHLRTNAFMGRRELLLELLPTRLTHKARAYRYESGWRSITRGIQRLGLSPRVVDRFGRSFAPEDWPASDTFWQGDQDSLMVADNQSDAYQRADLPTRLLLSRLAWGERAAPSAVASAS